MSITGSANPSNRHEASTTNPELENCNCPGLYASTSLHSIVPFPGGLIHTGVSVPSTSTSCSCVKTLPHSSVNSQVTSCIPPHSSHPESSTTGSTVPEIKQSPEEPLV